MRGLMLGLGMKPIRPTNLSGVGPGTGPIPLPPGFFTYLRPGGVFTFNRPDGVSLYIRP